MEADMAQVYFHCSNKEELWVDQRGRAVDDLLDIHQHAMRIAREFIANPGPEDWRKWSMYVSDADGEEILVVPFASVLGRLH